MGDLFGVGPFRCGTFLVGDLFGGGPFCCGTFLGQTFSIFHGFAKIILLRQKQIEIINKINIYMLDACYEQPTNYASQLQHK